MNTLIKPPCTNGTVSDKQVLPHLLSVNNKHINESNTRHFVLSDRHEEYKIYVYANAIEYARRLGYIVLIEEDGMPQSAYALKGYDVTTGALDKAQFSCVWLAEHKADTTCASASHIINKFKTAMNWTQFFDNAVDSILCTVNDCLLEPGKAVTKEQVESFVTSNTSEILKELTQFNPHYEQEPWHYIMTDYLYWDELADENLEETE